MAHFFVSYTSTEPDQQWAYWIGHELGTLGHNAYLFDWEVAGGDDMADWMEKRHDASDHILCICSNSYFEDSKIYSRWERQAAQWASIVNKRKRFLLPVYIEACKTPPLFGMIKGFNLYEFEQDEAAARGGLKAFIGPAEKSPPTGFPGTKKLSAVLDPSAPRFPGVTALWTLTEPVHSHGFEFYADRDTMARRKLGDILRESSSIKMLLVGGSGLIEAQADLAMVTQAILPHPNSKSLLSYMESVGDSSLAAKITGSTERLLKNGAQVVWYPQTVGHAILIVDSDSPQGWAQFESVLPFGALTERPRVIIRKPQYERLIRSITRSFDKMFAEGVAPDPQLLSKTAGAKTRSPTALR
jgi:hypothetical protein